MLNLEKILYRIVLGYYYIDVQNETYQVISPSFDIKYKAEILFDKIIEENKYDHRWLSENDIKYYLIINNIWNDGYDKQLKDLEKSIEDLKVDIYQNFLNKKLLSNLKRKLDGVQNEINKLYNRKRCLDYLGIRDHAFAIKNEFIIMHCIMTLNNVLVFDPTEPNINYSKLQSFIKEIIDQSINTSDLKKLVKSQLWKSYAVCCDFNKDLTSITDDYKYLINLHKMYDNARQHPEAPSEDIIDDDDALDGWFIFQNRKAEKEKKKNSTLSKINQNKLGQHNFIVADSPEEISVIQDLNGPEAAIIANEVLQYAKQENITEWQNIPAIKNQFLKEMEQMKGR